MTFDSEFGGTKKTPKAKKPEPGDLPEEIFRGISREELEKAISLRQIDIFWSDMVGGLLADHSRPSDIINSQLVITTTHTAYSQEIGFANTQILGFLHNKLKRKDIKSIRTKIGPVLRPKKKQGTKKTPSLEGKDELVQDLEKISDPKIREKLMELIQVLD
jgi:hypothetical protein